MVYFNFAETLIKFAEKICTESLYRTLQLMGVLIMESSCRDSGEKPTDPDQSLPLLIKWSKLSQFTDR